MGSRTGCCRARGTPDPKDTSPGERRDPGQLTLGLHGRAPRRPGTWRESRKQAAQPIRVQGGAQSQAPRGGAGRGGGEARERYYPEAEGSNYITNKPRAQAVN